ncbi:ABC transporter permease, partial [Francisella tularensis subsp. holarctica]|nr:ABC transporter permease [Francisella tularensis subsp. holarctica]
RYKKDKVAEISLFVIVKILDSCFDVPWFYQDNYYYHIDLYSKLRQQIMSISIALMIIVRDVLVRVLHGGQISCEVA